MRGSRRGDEFPCRNGKRGGARPRSVGAVIPQYYPLYIQEPGHSQTWLVLGWLPDRDSGLPRQPVVVLCGADTQEPRVLEQTLPFRVAGTGHAPHR
jgi:hypothetical protein